MEANSHDNWRSACCAQFGGASPPAPWLRVEICTRSSKRRRQTTCEVHDIPAATGDDCAALNHARPAKPTPLRPKMARVFAIVRPPSLDTDSPWPNSCEVKMHNPAATRRSRRTWQTPRWSRAHVPAPSENTSNLPCHGAVSDKLWVHAVQIRCARREHRELPNTCHVSCSPR